MGAPYSGLEVASFMTCSKGYMGECGIRGGYAEVINMDPGVMAMLQKSISDLSHWQARHLATRRVKTMNKAFQPSKNRVTGQSE